MAKKDEDEDDEENDDEETETKYKTKRTMKVPVNMDVETATALWWTIVGAALFIVGLILMSLSYTTLQLLTTVPTNAAVNLPSGFPQLSAQALNGGVILAVLGLLVMLWSKLKLSRLNLMR